MPDAGEELKVYVVELEVQGVALYSVEAPDADRACELAEQRAKPVDVTELEVVETRRVVELAARGEAARRAARGLGPQRRSKGLSHGRQA